MFHAADCVLVGVMTQPRDFRLARDEGWYRVPLRHAPECTTDAAVLAFYFTAAFGDDKWRIQWYSEVRGHELVCRRDLLPDQSEHPRADEPYYKLQIGPLIQREPPIPSLRWRRLSFISTTWDRFSAAEEVNDLYMTGAEGLYVTLKESGFFPEREYLIRENGIEYTADLAIPCQDGVVTAVWGDGPVAGSMFRSPDLATIRDAVVRLGGARGPGRGG
jgi:hypothetical protein